MSVVKLKGQTQWQAQDVSGLGRPYQLPINDIIDFFPNMNR